MVASVSTISDVLDLSRDLLQDTATPYRYSDERLIRTLNSAMRETFRVRPDLFLDDSYVLTTYTISDLATTFPIEDQYFNPVVEFIVGFIELADDEFTLDGRAATLLTAYRNQLIGGASLLGSAQ